ncbi:MAG: hypothetical protein IT503_04805 [Burkholderiaceae bacterium]|nr:hypothetical protein [Ideonella sp.]MCC7285480.1 hypothetical protein [Burkholderiaceae bacterium]
MNESTTPGGSAAFELRFRSLFHAGRALAFPCDGGGHVDVARLSAHARANLARARAAVGRDYALPAVEVRTLN